MQLTISFLFSKEKGKLLGYGAKNTEFFAYGGRIKCFLYVINTKRQYITPLLVMNDAQDGKDT